MPAIPFKTALTDAPRRLVVGLGLFFLLKLVFVAMYGGTGGAAGPVALLLALLAFMNRSVFLARLLGAILLLNAFGMALTASELSIETGPGFLVSITVAVAVTAGWGSFKYANALKKSAAEKRDGPGTQ